MKEPSQLLHDDESVIDSFLDQKPMSGEYRLCTDGRELRGVYGTLARWNYNNNSINYSHDRYYDDYAKQFLSNLYREIGRKTKKKFGEDFGEE